MLNQKTVIAIIHDNGTAGQCGATEYTAVEVEEAGGIDALLASYASAGITVLDTIDIIE